MSSMEDAHGVDLWGVRVPSPTAESRRGAALA